MCNIIVPVMKHVNELLQLSKRLSELGYRRKWKPSDELLFDRRSYPCRYYVERVMRLGEQEHLLLLRHKKMIRVSAGDERLIHIPRPEDVSEWFRTQSWLDFYVLRCDVDAVWESTFYYHGLTAFRQFRADDARLCSLQAMVSAWELLRALFIERTARPSA